MNKDIIIFDLDGTLADCSHRLHHIQKSPKNWRAFFYDCDKDSVIEHMRKVFDTFCYCEVWDHSRDYEVWIVSGRSDEVRAKTEKWLSDNGFKGYAKLIMRKQGDFTDDSVLKVSWLDDGTIPKDRVFCVFDDRDRVVKSWRDRGIPCFQVAEGNF